MKMKQPVVNAVSIAALLFAMSSPTLAGDAAAGKKIYDGMGACFTCHGATGKGDGAAAAALNPKPASFADGKFKYDTDGDGKTGTDADLMNVLKNGTAKYGGAATMPPRPDISGDKAKAVIAYIRSLKGK